MADFFPPAAPGHWLGLRRWAAQALLCEPLHERPHVLQLLEAAAERGETPGVLQIRGVRSQRDRTLFPDCHHDTELRRGVHPNGTARARLPDSSDRVLLLRLTRAGREEPRRAAGSTRGAPSQWPRARGQGGELGGDNFLYQGRADGNTNEAVLVLVFLFFPKTINSKSMELN